ncbi:MAG: HNH endonuclease [Chitinophagaceae bacterium]
MSRILIREDYYNMMLEIIELERISVGDYIETKYEEFKTKNTHFIEILYKDINRVLEGLLKDGEGDLVEKDGDWVEEYGDLKLSGPLNNLHYALMGLHQMKVEKMFETIQHPNEFIAKMDNFETDFLNIDYNTPEYNKKLSDLNKRLKNFRKGIVTTQEAGNKKIRKPIPQEKKVRAFLQKEINSQCPFCPSEDVGYFEIHHIDEDPSNNEINNLLLLCPTCHSKITKGDISINEVLLIKQNGKQKQNEIEFVSVVIDEAKCSWQNNKIENVFYRKKSKEKLVPIFNFTLLNHSDKTVILKRFNVKAKQIFSGINGIPPASVLKPIAQYFIVVDYSVEGTQLVLSEPIQIPSQQPVLFQVAVVEQGMNEYMFFDHATKLNFIFELSNNIQLAAPSILLNCENENQKIKVYQLS